MTLRRCARGFLAFAILSVFAARAESAQTIHLPPHEKVVLKNGLTLLLLEKRGVPLVDLAAVVKSGTTSDPAGQEGVASAVAELLRKGTAKRSARQFNAEMDSMGGSFDAGASFDFTHVSAEFLAKDFARGLNLFAEALLHPAFPQDEIDKLLPKTLDSIRGAKDNPQSVIGLYYQGYLFGSHPYGRSEIGDELSLKRIQRETVVKFYEANFVPGNTILAVVGEFRAAEMKKQLEDAFGGWPAKTAQRVSLPAVSPSKGKKLLLVDKPDATQTYFCIGNVGISVTDADRVAVEVVDTIFGERFTSMLNEALRVESGLTYGISSSFESRQAPGPFVISSFTRTEATVQAMDMTLQILAKLHKDGVSPEQLASAKSYIKGQFPPSIETSTQLAVLLAYYEAVGLGDDEVNQLEARVDAVTPEIARRVIEKHFPLDNLVFVLIGKASTIRPAVEKYAVKRDERAIEDPGFWPPPAAPK